MTWPAYIGRGAAGSTRARVFECSPSAPTTRSNWSTVPSLKVTRTPSPVSSRRSAVTPRRTSTPCRRTAPASTSCSAIRLMPTNGGSPGSLTLTCGISAISPPSARVIARYGCGRPTRTISSNNPSALAARSGGLCSPIPIPAASCESWISAMTHPTPRCASAIAAVLPAIPPPTTSTRRMLHNLPGPGWIARWARLRRRPGTDPAALQQAAVTAVPREPGQGYRPAFPGSGMVRLAVLLLHTQAAQPGFRMAPAGSLRSPVTSPAALALIADGEAPGVCADHSELPQRAGRRNPAGRTHENSRSAHLAVDRSLVLTTRYAAVVPVACPTTCSLAAPDPLPHACPARQR